MMFKFLLTILHLICNLNYRCQRFLHSWINYLKSISTRVKHCDIVRDGTKINKLPKHLGLIFTENELCLQDISKIVYWCFAVGLSEVSVYDLNGKWYSTEYVRTLNYEHRPQTKS